MKRLLVIIVLVAGCGGATVPSPSPAALLATNATQAPTVTPSLAPVATATVPSPSAIPDPEAVRKAAAKVYLTAAETANKANKALYAKYKTFGTLTRAYYKAAAKIEGVFIAAVKTLAVPADTSADLHSAIGKWAAVQALDIEGAGVKSWAGADSVDNALERASRTATGAANLVRIDLGLPPVHL